MFGGKEEILAGGEYSAGEEEEEEYSLEEFTLFSLPVECNARCSSPRK